MYEFEVLGIENNIYKVRVVFVPSRPKDAMGGAVDVVVFVTVDGDDFEIVGHEDPGSVGRKGTGWKAAARPD